VAVDWTNRDRVLFEHGIPEERVRVILNWADLDRFPPRPPLPEHPQRALAFSNYARNDTHLPAVEEACRRAGLELDVVGSGAGRSLQDPGGVIARYDLVFAKAKSAIEAMAVGTAVVLCDYRGLGQMVTSADFDALRRLNFGLRTLDRPLAPDLIRREIERYDPRDAAAVSERVRQEAGLQPALDRLIALYEEVIAEQQREPPSDPVEELRAAAAYLRLWSGWTPPLRELVTELDQQRQRLDLQVRELLPLPQRVRELEEEVVAVKLRSDLRASELEKDLHQAQSDPRPAELERELRAVRLERDHLQEMLSAAFGTITWRLREKLMRLPGLRPAWEKVRRSDQRR
jgi:hypothetical protein